MSTETGSGGEQTMTSVQGSWRYLMGAGAILAILGVLAIIFPFVTGLALSLLLGALLVVGSILHFAHAFSAQKWTGAVWQILLGLLYVVAGIALMANPVVGITTLTILLIAYFLVDGVIEIVMGFQLRGEHGWGWMIASGVISLILAGLIWVNFPSSAAWAVGLLFGVGLLTTGISMMLVANGGRRAVQEAPAAPAAGSGGA